MAIRAEPLDAAARLKFHHRFAIKEMEAFDSLPPAYRAFLRSDEAAGLYACEVVPIRDRALLMGHSDSYILAHVKSQLRQIKALQRAGKIK